MKGPTKAGWVEAPCRIMRVEGYSVREGAMRVDRIERDPDTTTFIGVGVFTKLPARLTVPNHVYMEVL